MDSASDVVSEMYRDKDAIIRTLVAADEVSLIPVFGHMRDEEILQQQLEHLVSSMSKVKVKGKVIAML